jgi:sugar lactone lactonase YvrE
VTSSLGVDCPATCSAIFGYGHYVTLTARPDPGSTFFGWAGCDLATGVNCTMTMFSSRSVTAVFAKSAVFARIDRVAGDGHPCMVPPGCGDGPSATFAELNNPSGVALDSRGDLYIADSGDKEVREVTPGGAISRIAGTGVSCAAGLNATGCGDGGRATAATFDRPAGVAVDSHGDVYVADYRDSAIRKFAPGGTISTVAGNGLACFGNLPGCGDGGPAKGPTLVEPEGVAVDSGGNLFIADASQNAIREVSQAGIITTLAGLGSNNWCTTAPNCGDGGPAADAKLQTPHGVAVDSSGDVYVADTGDNEIRKITPDKRISLVFGNGFVCTSGTCTSGRADAVLHGPQAVAVDAAGDVYIADTNANQVLELTPDGTINRIAGAGGSCDPPDCGDGNAAFSAQLAGPKGLALDPTGALYIADAFHNEVRVVR